MKKVHDRVRPADLGNRGVNTHDDPKIAHFVRSLAQSAGGQQDGCGAAFAGQGEQFGRAFRARLGSEINGVIQRENQGFAPAENPPHSQFFADVCQNHFLRMVECYILLQGRRLPSRARFVQLFLPASRPEGDGVNKFMTILLD